MSLFTKYVNPKDKKREDENKLEIQRARTPEELAEIEKEQAKKKFEEAYKKPSEDILWDEWKSQNLLWKLEAKFEWTNNIERAVERLVQNEPNISKNLSLEDREELQILVTEYVIDWDINDEKEKQNHEWKIDINSLPKEVKENPDFPVLKLALDKEEITMKDFNEIISKVDEKTDFKHAIKEANLSIKIRKLLEEKYKKLEQNWEKVRDFPDVLKETLKKYWINEEKKENWKSKQETLYDLIKQNYNLYIEWKWDKIDEQNISITIEKVFNTLIYWKRFIRTSEYFKQTEKVLRWEEHSIWKKLIYLKSIYRYLNTDEIKAQNTNISDIEEENKNIENWKQNVEKNEKPKDKFERVQEILKKAKENWENKVKLEQELKKKNAIEEENDVNNADDELDKLNYA